MVVGGLAATSARFVAKVPNGPVRIVYSANADMSAPSFSASTAVDGQGVAKVTVTGLTANTQYYWQVEDNGIVATSVTGQFRTHPTLGTATSFSFAAAACSGQSGSPTVTDDVSDHEVFDTIRQHPVSPRFFVHLGDLHYRNISANTPSLFRQAYDDVLSYDGTLGTAARQAKLYRAMGLVYVWDDHDFGGDESDSTATAAPAAQSVYRERVPHYDLDSASAIYQSFGCGRVLFICSDVRSARSPNTDPDGPSKTMLGAAQKTWMETLLTTPGFDAQFLIWVMPSQWMGTSSDSWDSFQTERDELVTMFGDLDWLDRMCIVSGDVHALAIDSGTGNTWGGFPVYQFASMDSQPQDAPTNQYDTGPTLPGRNQYGTVHVHDNGGTVAVTGVGWRGTAAVMSHTSSIPLTSRRRGSPSHVLAL